MDWTLAQVSEENSSCSVSRRAKTIFRVRLGRAPSCVPQYLPESFEQLAYDYGLKKLVDKYDFPKARSSFAARRDSVIHRPASNLGRA